MLGRGGSVGEAVGIAWRIQESSKRGKSDYIPALHGNFLTYAFI